MAHEVSISGETNAGDRSGETVDTSHFHIGKLQAGCIARNWPL